MRLEFLYEVHSILNSDPNLLIETLNAHNDAVWSVALHSSDNRLISASCDGLIKLWEPGAL